jgi:hypothetical protein
MTDKTNETLVLVLVRASDGHRIAVSMESFLRFNSEIDEGLEELVLRWADYMTAVSARMENTRR